jgi:hypothetical protein
MVVEKIWEIKSQLQETRAVQVAHILASSMAAAADGSHPIYWEPFARMPQWSVPGVQIDEAACLSSTQTNQLKRKKLKIKAIIKAMPSRYLRRSLTQVGVAQRQYAATLSAAMEPPTAAMTSQSAPLMKPVLTAAQIVARSASTERPAPT